MRIGKVISFVFILFFSNSLVQEVASEICWSSIGPSGGGCLNKILVVNKGKEKAIYVGCDIGGIYKSTNDGAHWDIINNGLTNYDVADIICDPQSAETLYIGTYGGVFKSINGGESWVEKRKGFPAKEKYFLTAPISSIIIDPQHPNVIYASVGIKRDYAQNSSNWNNVKQKGAIYKSTNYGESWSLIRNTGISTKAMIFSLAIDPSNSSILYAGTDCGFYKSTDAGGSWISKNNGLPHKHTAQIAIDPINSNVLYLTIWTTQKAHPWQGGVYKSTDAGETWIEKNNGLNKELGNPGNYNPTSNYMNIIINPDNPQILYVTNLGRFNEPGIFKTTDAADHWNRVTRHEKPNINVDCGWINFFDWLTISSECIALDPFFPNHIYFGTSAIICKTVDAGENWTQIYTDPTGLGYWKGRGLETTCVLDIAIDPIHSNNIYIGYADIGFLKSVDGGVSFKRSVSGVGYDHACLAIAIDPESPNIIYAAFGESERTSQGGVYKSMDWGEHWQSINNGLARASTKSLVIDPKSDPDSRILYAGTWGYGVYKTTDGGKSWIPVNNGLEGGEGIEDGLRIRKIIIHPIHSNILYAVLSRWAGMVGGEWKDLAKGGIFKSIDGGNNWEKIDTLQPQPNVFDLVINPDNPDILYSAVEDYWDENQEKRYPAGVFKSTDGGNTWELTKKGLGDYPSFNSIAINPLDTNVLYVTTLGNTGHDLDTGRGVYRSANAGATWTQINEGLGVLSLNNIVVDPANPRRLYLGTVGNGIFTAIDPEVGIAVKRDVQVPDKFNLYQNYPNPFNGYTTIRYQIPQDAKIELTIYNQLGEKIRTLVDCHHVAGEYRIQWDGLDDSGADGATALYFCQMKAERFAQTIKIILIR